MRLTIVVFDEQGKQVGRCEKTVHEIAPDGEGQLYINEVLLSDNKDGFSNTIENGNTLCYRIGECTA